jgi:hypothetical protein
MKTLFPGWRFYLSAFPRPLLNAVETRFLPQSLDSIPEIKQIAREWAPLRVAVIKQSLYGDLYCLPPGQAPASTAGSSLRRTGPLGLVVDLQAKFWMVHEDSAPECRCWEESVGSNPATREADLERARNFPNEPLPSSHPFAGKTPHSMAVTVDEVPWGDFDVVITIDASVPLRIIRSHPKISWIYFPADPGTATAKRARRNPPEGYSFSLTHTHRRFAVRPGLSSAAIECPYSFQSSYSWDQVWTAQSRREGVMVEHQTFAMLDEEQRKQLAALGTVRKPQGSVSEVTAMLRASKYYLRLQGGPLTGNGQVEAIMAGCLALGDPSTFVQRSLFIPQTVTPDFRSALGKMHFFESNQAEHEKARVEQLAVAEFVCFRRPAWELLQAIRQTL